MKQHCDHHNANPYSCPEGASIHLSRGSLYTSVLRELLYIFFNNRRWTFWNQRTPCIVITFVIYLTLVYHSSLKRTQRPPDHQQWYLISMMSRSWLTTVVSTQQHHLSVMVHMFETNGDTDRDNGTLVWIRMASRTWLCRT